MSAAYLPPVSASPTLPRWMRASAPALALSLAALLPAGAAAGAGADRPGPSGESSPPDARATGGTAPTPAARDTAGAWNSARVMRLVASAVEARRHAWADSSLHAFRAEAQGHVYFLGGLGAGAGAAGIAPPGELQVVRADQVALEVRWARGDALQTIVGRRSEKRLPTRIRYHIDHLSLILQNFGDRISLGEGTEVRDVPHPVAPGGTGVYEYRLADSLGIGIAGETRTLYRVEVRPREPSAAAVVGEVHLDAGSRAVARMHFTFTPAAYRDDDVESIEVELESALWDGRWWLPAEQEVTVRRQVRWLDFPVTGIIRTRIRVHDYRINPEPPPRLSAGRRVVTLPERRLDDFSGWRSGLYDGPVRAPTGAEPEAEDLRRRARELMAGRYLGGQARLAPSLSGVSDVIRARRAEGGLGGMGGRYRLDDGRTLRVWAGHPFEAGGTEWIASYRSEAGPLGLEVSAYGDRLTDVGPVDASSGVVSTFGFLLKGEDFTDPYFRDGASVAVGARRGDGRLRARLAWERHEAALLVADPPGMEEARPVRPAAAGELGSLTLGWTEPLGRILASRLTLEVDAEGATSAVGDYGFTRVLVGLTARSLPGAGPWSWRLRAGAGAGGGELPPQRLFLLGGRGTVPGYAFRSWGGDRAGWARLAVARDVPGLGPWVRLRAIAAAGWTDVGAAGRAAAGSWSAAARASASAAAADADAPASARLLPVTQSGGVRPSLGAGLGFLDGALRVDAVRGLDGGGWEWMVSVAPRFRGVL